MADQKIDPGSEFQLLLWVVRVDTDTGNLRQQFMKPGTDPAAVLRLATVQGVRQLVYERIKDFLVNITDQERLRFREAFLIHSGRNLRLAGKLVQLLGIMEGHGIAAVPFKGPELAIRAYGDVALRDFCDLDILIRSGDFEKVYDILEGAGYRSGLPAISGMKSLWARSGRDFLFLDQNTVFDIHQRLHQGHRKFRLDEGMWQNLTSINLLSRRLPVLSAEDSLLLLAVHAAKHRWQPLKWVVDAAHFTAAQPTLAWREIYEKAGEMGCRRILGVTLSLCRDISGLALPVDVDGMIKKDPKTVALTEKFKGELMARLRFGRLHQFMGITESLDTVRDKIRYVGYYIFTPSAGDLMLMPIPVRLYPLYYILRPFRQLFKYLKKIFKLVFKGS